MGNLVGEKIEGWVSGQISSRQKLQNSGFNNPRSAEQINILNNQNAWLKLASSVRVDNNDAGKERLKSIGLSDSANFVGNNLARQAVLFNTLSTVTPTKDKVNGSSIQRAGVTQKNSLWNSSNIYGLGGSKFGLTPPPGLISAKVDCKNRGSIREASIELKCYNQFQFQLLELLYLRLGYSMILEWGWDKYLDNNSQYKTTGNTLTEDVWFNDFKGYNFQKLIDTVQVYRRKYNGNYDGFIGKVVNFSWKFDPDGTYNITLKLITVGDVIESIKTNLPIANIPIAAIQLEASSSIGTKDILDSTIVTTAGNSTLNYNLYTDITGNSAKWVEKEGNYLGLYNQLAAEGNAFKDTNLEEPKEGGAIANLDNYNYFLTLGEFLSKLKQLVLPSVSNISMLDIDMDEEENICSTFPYIISLDPKICLIKPFILDDYSYQGGSSKLIYINNDWTWMSNMKPFGVVENDGATLYGKVMNIYLNYDFITKCINEVNEKGELSIFKLLEKICNGVNGALGNTTKLEPILMDDRTITIIDQNPINGIELSSAFKDRFNVPVTPFEIFGYNNTVGESNFVRDFGFDTKITPELASMITISAGRPEKSKNYDGTAFSKWNDGLSDAYQFEYTDPITKTPAEISKIQPFSESQLDQTINHFNASTKDEYYYADALSVITDFASKLITGKGTKRPNNNTIYKAYGKSGIGVRDVVNCPVTGKSYNNVRWDEYSKQVADWLQSEIAKKEKEANTKTEDANYISYLTTAFGGRVNNDNTPKTTADARYYQLNPDFISQGKAAFSAFQTSFNNKVYEETKNPSNVVGFIPVDLNLSCDGLSGIKIYQELEVRQDFLPSQYPKALKFLITKVNHDISDNDWKTSLGTISTPATKGFTGMSLNIVQIVNDVVTDTNQTYSKTSGGRSRNIEGTNYKNGQLPEDKLRTINFESKYKGDIQSDGGRIRLYPKASIALDQLLEAAEKDKIKFKINSGYRTYADQERVRRDYPKTSAPAGTSNHGYGLAVDFANPGLSAAKPTSDGYKWLIKNAGKYGFARLPYAKKHPESWESWHWEYQI